MLGDDARTLAMLEYADKLTRQPAACGQEDIEQLRAQGLDDRAITDLVEVCAYFNYINRIADGLGIEPEDWLDDLGRPRESES